jgi:hypothetical protein
MALDPLSSLLDVGKALIDKLIPDPQAKAAATQKLLEMQQTGDLATMEQQTRINAVEAASPNMFIAGWRPFIGWVCGGALAVQLVVAPIAVQISGLAGHPVPMVVLDTTLLSTLVISMLGLGGMRTVEKMQGAQGNH